MIMRKALLVAVFILCSHPASTETLKIAVGSQGDKSITIPARGQTQDQVSLEYGQPERSTQNIGEPPISTWHYDRFSVYFESDRVIHSVLRH